ncbi:MAG: immune inhibitor A [Chloroflexi bacterium]|nr:immune inhibitor A [Chloroflexota bacterium]
MAWSVLRRFPPRHFCVRAAWRDVALLFVLVVVACQVEPTASPTSGALQSPAPPIAPTRSITPPSVPAPTPTAPGSPAPTPTAPASPAPAAATSTATIGRPATSVELPTPPARDPYEVAERLRRATAIPRVLRTTAPEYEVGHRQTFWVTNMETFVHFTVTALLRVKLDHIAVYVQDGVEIVDADLRRSAERFERETYPTIRRYFGTEWTPGVDGDPRLTILNARIPGVAGYYSVADEYPRAINPYSNEREMIYVNAGALRPGTPGFDAVLAHEFQHAVNWNMRRGEEAWVAEGMAEVGAKLAGFSPSFVQAFQARPDTQLNAWPDDLKLSSPHYGASTLFFDYLAQHYGGYDALRELNSDPLDGIDGVNAYLRKKGYTATFQDVFDDWVVANYLNDPGLPRFGYQGGGVKVRAGQTLAAGGVISGSVHQFAAEYVELRLPTGDARIRFEGARTVPVLPTTARSGRAFWWSNRGDSVNTHLTRAVDLSGVSRATLTFWLWYDVEENWDYAYVEVSRDGGRTWEILAGRHSSRDNPLGHAFGPGYTGKSGGGKTSEWVEDRIDLTPYAGQRILLRFEYVTDEGVNNSGLAIDDLDIPEIGFHDDAESNAGWDAGGFARTENRLPQRYRVRVITGGAQTQVVDLPLDGENRGELLVRGVGTTVERAVVVVAARTPVTTLEAPFTLRAEVP